MIFADIIYAEVTNHSNIDHPQDTSKCQLLNGIKLVMKSIQISGETRILIMEGRVEPPGTPLVTRLFQMNIL